MVSAIILDYDGVIRFNDEEMVANVLSKHGFEHSEFFSMLWDNSLVRKLITGKLDRKTWWNKLQELHPELGKLDHTFLWNEVFVYPIINHDLLQEIELIIDKSTSQIKTGILSNADKISTQTIMEQMSTYSFDLIMTSSKLGIAKPNPVIYNQLLETLQLSPDEVLFFDDSKKNVEAANDMGIHAYYYDNLATSLEIIKSHTQE